MMIMNKKTIDVRNDFMNKNYNNETVNGEKTLDYINTTTDAALKINYHVGVFSSVINLVLYHIMANHKADALHQLQKAEELMTTYDLSKTELLNLHRIHSIYFTEITYDLESAIEHSQKAMQLAEELGLKDIQMRIKANMAVINQSLGFNEIAADYLNESIAYAELIKDDHHLTYYYLNMGIICFALNQFDKSESYHKRSLQLAKEYHNLPVTQEASAGLSQLYIKQSRYKLALETLSDSKLITSNRKTTKYDMNIILSLAQLHMAQEKFQEAYDILIKYEHKLDEIEHKPTQTEYYELASKVASQLADYQTAYEYMLKYQAIYEEVTTINSEKLMNKVIQNQYKKALNRLENIANIGREITTLDDLCDVLMEVKKILSNLMTIDSIGIGKYDHEQIIYDHFYSEGVLLDPIVLNVNDESSLAAWCIRNNKPIIVNDLDEDSKIYTNRPLIKKGVYNNIRNNHINALMYMPLVVKNEVLGVFTLQSTEKFAYTQEDMEMFKIVSSYVAIALKNITQAKTLEKLSITDSLTCIMNRRGFTDYFTDMMRLGSQLTSIGMLMIDLDYFKKINDEHGHLTGDLMLQAIARILKDTESKHICPARLGGEEFGFILINMSEEAVMTFAEEIRSRIMSLRIVKQQHNISVTTSIGVSYNSYNTNLDFKICYHEADSALYEAKENGRNQVVLYK